MSTAHTFFMKPTIMAAILTLTSCMPTQPITGTASYYAMSYIGKPMANGDLYHPDNYTMACWDLPLGTIVRVTYRSRGGSVRSVIVTVTDRGPAKHLLVDKPATDERAAVRGRQFDLSWAAFRTLENHKVGLIPVTVEVLSPDELQ
jgi:rare lipoprotein A